MTTTQTVQHLDDANFADVVRPGETVLVDFAADWCPPCRQLAPTVEELAAEQEGVVVAKIDVDQSPRVTAQYQVSALPTVLVLKDGEVAERLVGVHPKHVYERALTSVA